MGPWSGVRVLVELEAHAGGDDHVELAPAPRFQFQGADGRGDGAVLLVERIQVRDADAEAGVLRPLAVGVGHQVERHAVPLDARHARRLPRHRKPHVLTVKGERVRQAAPGGDHGRDGEKRSAHGRRGWRDVGWTAHFQPS